MEGSGTEATSDICPLPQVDTDSSVYDEYIASRRYHRRHGQVDSYPDSKAANETICKIMLAVVRITAVLLIQLLSLLWYPNVFD